MIGTSRRRKRPGCADRPGIQSNRSDHGRVRHRPRNSSYEPEEVAQTEGDSAEGTIGRERLRQILDRHGITFQRTKTWKESNDPERNAKLERIEEVLNNFPDRCFAFDEFGPLAVHPTKDCCWAPRKHPQRLRANFHKTCGVRQFHGCYSYGDDTVWGVVRQKKSVKNSLAAIRSCRQARPDGLPIYVILDNLSAHKSKKIRHWCVVNHVELCFTPTYSSWANPIESHFGPLRCFVLNNSDPPNHTVLARRLHAYLRWRNANARNPEILALERKRRAQLRAEKQRRWGRPAPRAANGSATTS